MKSPTRIAVQAALLTLAGFPLQAPAFQPLVTDDTGTQGGAGNQLEFSLNQDRKKVAGDIERLRTFPVVYTRGLTETLDIFAGLSHARIRSDARAGDAGASGNPLFGAKWRFYENAESRTSFAVKPEVLFAVSAGREGAGLGKGKTSGKLTLVLTEEVAFGSIHMNAGVGRDRYRDTLSNPDTTTTRASIAPVWNLTGQWKLALDLGTESAHGGGTRVRSNFVELGAIYSPSGELDFALAILSSSNNDSPGAMKHTVSAGITRRFR